MAIHHYSVHSPLQSPYNLFLLANEIPTKKRVLIVPLLEREKGWGVGKKHVQKCINLYILHPLTHKKKKRGVPFTLLIACMKILFLNLAATIFDLD
ncbi:unnamed protein product [Sphagnum jensenii]